MQLDSHYTDSKHADFSGVCRTAQVDKNEEILSNNDIYQTFLVNTWDYRALLGDDQGPDKVLQHPLFCCLLCCLLCSAACSACSTASSAACAVIILVIARPPKWCSFSMDGMGKTSGRRASSLVDPCFRICGVYVFEGILPQLLYGVHEARYGMHASCSRRAIYCVCL